MGGGEEREINMVEDCFKMYELLKKFSQASLMSHCAARIQMPVLLSVNQSINQSETFSGLTVFTREQLREQPCDTVHSYIYVCVYIWWASVCLC